MTTKVFLNGTMLDQEDAKISVFDRGFLYGDSVYEVLRTSGGNSVDLKRHLTRLFRSAALLALPAPTEQEVETAISSTIAAAGNPESYVRVVLTRGAGPITLRVGASIEPTLVVIAKPLDLPTELSERGAALRIVAVQRTSPHAVDPSVKSGNYLNNILALDEAVRAGADEALMCDAQGRIAEGSTSNVFIVSDGRLMTPALNIGLLPGITRQRVIELALGEGWEVMENSFTPEQVRGADEVFITSSVRGVVAASSVDGRAVGSRFPGAKSARLIELYQQFLQQVASGQLD